MTTALLDRAGHPLAPALPVPMTGAPATPTPSGVAGELPQRPSTGKGRLITCRNCNRRQVYYADHLCSACWKRWDNAGRPAEVPAPKKRGPAANRDARLQDYIEAITVLGAMSASQAAKRLRVTPRTIFRYRAILRQEGRP